MKQTFVKAAVLACCMAAVGCKQAPMTMGPGEYAVMTIATTDREIPSNYSATIRGRQDIAIYPQVSGTISQLCVNEGQKVAKGQTLFIIDQVPYKAALQTAEANVEAAKAGVATAQLTYDSKKELFARNVVSQFDLSTANNNLLTAKAQLAQAEAQRVNAANTLSYTVVKAPTDGVVGTLPYRVGALVSASIPQPLTTVSDNSEMYVYFSMTENQLLALTRACRAYSCSSATVRPTTRRAAWSRSAASSTPRRAACRCARRSPTRTDCCTAAARATSSCRASTRIASPFRRPQRSNSRTKYMYIKWWTARPLRR